MKAPRVCGLCGDPEQQQQQQQQEEGPPPPQPLTTEEEIAAVLNGKAPVGSANGKAPIMNRDTTTSGSSSSAEEEKDGSSESPTPRAPTPAWDAGMGGPSSSSSSSDAGGAVDELMPVVEVAEAAEKAEAEKAAAERRSSIALGSAATGSDPQPPSSPRTNFEHCRFCGRLARPNILMFDDAAWIGDAPGPLGVGHSQAGCYKKWEASVKAALQADRKKRLVILEVGCGLRVPTVRRHTEKLLKSTSKFGTKVIRINLDHPEPRKGSKEANSIISLREGGLEALSKIDRFMTDTCTRHGVRMPIAPPPPLDVSAGDAVGSAPASPTKSPSQLQQTPPGGQQQARPQTTTGAPSALSLSSSKSQPSCSGPASPERPAPPIIMRGAAREAVHGLASLSSYANAQEQPSRPQQQQPSSPRSYQPSPRQQQPQPPPLLYVAGAPSAAAIALQSTTTTATTLPPPDAVEAAARAALNEYEAIVDGTANLAPPSSEDNETLLQQALERTREFAPRERAGDAEQVMRQAIVPSAASTIEEARRQAAASRLGEEARQQAAASAAAANNAAASAAAAAYAPAPSNQRPPPLPISLAEKYADSPVSAYAAAASLFRSATHDPTMPPSPPMRRPVGAGPPSPPPSHEAVAAVAAVAASVAADFRGTSMGYTPSAHAPSTAQAIAAAHRQACLRATLANAPSGAADLLEQYEPTGDGNLMLMGAAPATANNVGPRVRPPWELRVLREAQRRQRLSTHFKTTASRSSLQQALEEKAIKSAAARGVDSSALQPAPASQPHLRQGPQDVEQLTRVWDPSADAGARTLAGGESLRPQQPSFPSRPLVPARGCVPPPVPRPHTTKEESLMAMAPPAPPPRGPRFGAGVEQRPRTTVPTAVSVAGVGGGEAYQRFLEKINLSNQSAAANAPDENLLPPQKPGSSNTGSSRAAAVRMSSSHRL